MAKNKNKFYSLAIDNIQEISYNYNGDFNFLQLSNTSLIYEMNNSIKIDNEKDIIGLRLGICYRYAETNESLAEYKILVNFKIPELNELVSKEKDKLKFEDNSLLMNLLHITIGTLRGALFLKLKGTPLEKFPLPLIPYSSLEKVMATNNNNQDSSTNV